MKKPELLAPAGSFEALMAAIGYGADAVYAGGSKYSARSSAENFTSDKLKEAAEYCHVRGKKLYLAVNTLILDRESDEFLSYIDEIIPACPDALILQDPGTARKINEIYPDLPLHASTQLSLHNSYGIDWAQSLGFKRVVIARETPVSDIKNICSQNKTEIEAFVHGALCISFSGQCLMSSMAGRRSGNRGRCAQPCRLPYSIDVLGTQIDKDYCLSTKDLCALPCLADLIDAGVSSLKIEGRLKRPEYVASVVSQYRAALDALSDGRNIDIGQAEKEMAKIFNRGGFTRGYYIFDGKQTGRLPLSPNPAGGVIFNKKPNHCGILCAKVISFDSRKTTVLFSETVPKGSDILIGENVLRTASDYSIGDKESFKNSSAKKGEPVYLLNDSASLSAWSKSGPFGLVKLTADLLIRTNEKAILTVSDGERSIAVTGDDTAAPASGKGTPEHELKEKLNKTGGTPFVFDNIKIDTDGSFLRVSAINSLRRKALDAVFAARVENLSNIYEKTDRTSNSHSISGPQEPFRNQSNQPPSSSAYDPHQADLDKIEGPCPTEICTEPASCSHFNNEYKISCSPSRSSSAGINSANEESERRDYNLPCAEDITPARLTETSLELDARLSDFRFNHDSRNENIRREISAEVRTASMLSALAPYADRLYYSPLEYSRTEIEKAMDACPPSKLHLVLPPVMMNRDFDYLENTLKDCFPLMAGAVVCNPGQAVYARSMFREVSGDYQLNIINKESLMLYSQICDRITVSAEATLAQARDLCRIAPCELLVYGRIALMNLTHCHLKDKGYCGVCRASLTDRGGRVFPMERYSVQTCCMRVLNCDKLNMSAHTRDFNKINACAYRFMFTDETEEQAISAVQAFEAGTPPAGKGYTAGHYYRGLNDE